MVSDFLSTSDGLWRDILQRVHHDVYHLPEYLRVSGTYERGQPAAFQAREGNSFSLIPLLIRRLPAALAAPEDWRDAKSPYGYPAPLFCGDSRWAHRALECFVAECRARNIVSAFLRWHPLLPVPSNLSNYGQLVKHGETVYLDLSLAENTLWSQTRQRFRTYINRLRRAGFQVRFDDWTAFQNYVSIYWETMARLEADEFYYFPEQYFHDLRAALGPRLHFCAVFDPSGELASGALFTETEGIVQYHLSGTADRFRTEAPSKLMLHEAALWAKRQGHRVLHLGGGLGGRADSLFHFKSGFSPLRSDFLTYRLVCDESKYAYLCREIEAPHSDGDYFPKYREPASSESDCLISCGEE